MTWHRYFEVFWAFDGSESCTKIEWVIFSIITILLWVVAVLIIRWIVKWRRSR